MIRTTMAHKQGGNPGKMTKNIPGKPSSKKVIHTTVSKPSCGSDSFVYERSGKRPIDTTVVSQI